MINSKLECRRLLDNVLSVAVQNATMKCVFKESQCYKAPPPILTGFAISCMHRQVGDMTCSIKKTPLFKTLVHET